MKLDQHLTFVLNIDLCHDYVLAFLDKLVFGFDNSLKELEVLDIASVCFNAVDKVLHHSLVDLTA